jgi:hypothetical protein
LPEPNLVVQVRLVQGQPAPLPAAGSDTDAAVAARAPVTVGTARAADAPAQSQQVVVLNGQRASFRFGRSMPLHWVQAASMQVGSSSAGSASSSHSGGSLVNAVTWLDAGQGMGVQARWPGGSHPVTLTLDFETSQVDPRVGAELPATTHGQVQTTVSVPLGQWFTFATVGSEARPLQAGVWSTAAPSTQPPQAFQVRVSLP